MSLPAGSVAMLLGFEMRKETYQDDRDDRLDGTIQYTSLVTGYGFPFVGDILGSSPTADTSGERTTKSVFAEFQIPLSSKVESQLAIRHESPDDVEASTVGKFAIGWDAAEDLLVRASTSTSFRVPNLIQENQLYVPRQGSITDAVGKFVGANDPLDDSYSMQSFRLRNPDLLPEDSTNKSMGFVYTPSSVNGLTITFDKWQIRKENTIVLLGRTNALVNDLLLRLNYGPNNCSAFSNPNVIRLAADYDAGETANFTAAGICPAGEAQIVYDPYTNAATRLLAGTDIGIYYDVETNFGDFKFTINRANTDKFEQSGTNSYAPLAAAVSAGTLPADVTLSGFGDLRGLDGNYTEKTTIKGSYRLGNWGVQVSSLEKGEFYQNSETLSDGTRYMIPSMRVVNASVYYKFDLGDSKARVKFAVKNIDDERAPLADRFYGFYSDAHQDYGRNYYLDFKVSF
jgi:hypothetical protein